MEFKWQGKGDSKKYTYTLLDETTGQDYLNIRRKQGADLSTAAFYHANLVHRLQGWDRPEPLSEEALLNLPQGTYHVLYNAALRIDNEELKEGSTFLAQLWGISTPRESPSESKDSSEPQASSSDKPSQSEKSSTKSVENS